MDSPPERRRGNDLLPPAMKTVGRRADAPVGIEDAARLLRTAWALRRTHKLVPRGVFRFATFEEADEWMNRMMVLTLAPRISTTSHESAGR